MEPWLLVDPLLPADPLLPVEPVDPWLGRGRKARSIFRCSAGRMVPVLPVEPVEAAEPVDANELPEEPWLPAE